MAETADSPEDGHTFRFRFDIRGSSKVVGDPQRTDGPDFMGPVHEIQVRAWNLRDALRKAADLPFGVLMGTEVAEPAAETADAPIRDGERVWIAGEPVWVHYDPDLTVDGTPRWGCSTWEPTGLNSVEVKPYGAVQEATHVQVGMRRVIRLRRWDERVFLHEVLHVLLGKQYPPGQHAYDGTFIEDPKHEKAVREIEDGLWDMGWRLFGGQSHIDPSLGPRLPGLLFPPGLRCPTCVHPEGYDRLSGPCPTCHGDGVIPPEGSH